VIWRVRRGKTERVKKDRESAERRGEYRGGERVKRDGESKERKDRESAERQRE
jgi:hypothetical protein